ncbi:hypothetical protein ACQPXH_17510 [Nocardia sp. CA-135953]|uniref:hypothetical protein n=1 Tax=Nocardia sp. CA-135953 TaxID=3239978 RepID=UPI003D989159
MEKQPQFGEVPDKSDGIHTVSATAPSARRWHAWEVKLVHPLGFDEFVPFIEMARSVIQLMVDEIGVGYFSAMPLGDFSTKRYAEEFLEGFKLEAPRTAWPVHDLCELPMCVIYLVDDHRSSQLSIGGLLCSHSDRELL